MSHRNELFITGRIVTPPTLGRMPSGTSLLWFLIESEESFIDKANRDVFHVNSFRVEMLGSNVSIHADSIKPGKHCYIRGYIRSDNGVIKIRVRHFELEKTYYEGYTSAMDIAIAALKDSDDIKRTIEQLQIVRDSCDPKKGSSAQN
jgi:primosomal replication protein N